MSLVLLIILVIFFLVIVIYLATPKKVFKNNNQRIVITLTSTPKRLSEMGGTLKSLMNQTRKADCIYLNLPYFLKRTGEEYILPLWLTKLEEEGKVVLNRCTDMGPLTKLAPCLSREMEDETLIIVVDDDEIYPSCLVEKYLKYTSEYPNQALTLGGVISGKEKINFNSSEIFNWLSFFNNFGATSVFILSGYLSYVVKRKFFEDDFIPFVNTTFEKESAMGKSNCFFSDDLVISYYLDLKGIRKKPLRKLDFNSWFVWGTSLAGDSDALHRKAKTSNKYHNCYTLLNDSTVNPKGLNGKTDTQV
jgi:hypothetical protein